MALSAVPTGIARMVVGEAMGVLLLGLALGIFGAIEIVGVVRDAAIDHVRTETPAVREAVRQLAPALPLLAFRTQDQQVQRGFARERVLARAAGFFLTGYRPTRRAMRVDLTITIRHD